MKIITPGVVRAREHTYQHGQRRGRLRASVVHRGQAACEGDICDEHRKRKCSVCGEQATHECDHTGQFVCGAPLCPNCEGHTDTTKPSGGWGFMNHSHRRKEIR